jgi:hypothetical protein
MTKYPGANLKMMSDNNAEPNNWPVDKGAKHSLTANNIGDTVRIRRPPRVVTNDLGRSVWMSEVEPVELEIELDSAVSTNPYDSGQSVSA